MQATCDNERALRHCGVNTPDPTGTVNEIMVHPFHRGTLIDLGRVDA